MASASGRVRPGDPLGTVKQELLVRYLDAWTPAALHSARQVTYVDGYDGRSALASMRVFAEFADVLARHELHVVLVDGGQERLSTLTQRLSALAANLPGLRIRPVLAQAPGDLLAALTADRAFAMPVLAFLDTTEGGPGIPGEDLLAALAGSRAGEVFIAVEPDHDLGPAAYRRSLLAAGFRFATVVELVADDGTGRLLFFATSAIKSLERFKDALWAVDEYAGVRYRDPRTANHPLLDISLEPHVGPLRRVLLAHLADTTEDTVAQLRQYALAETLYRPVDVNRALTPLLAAGQLVREPERGRLTPQTIIRPAEAGRRARAS